jgi:hypothetical protein
MIASSFRVFISYRRSDALGYAGGLSHSLETAFGMDQVFRDTVAIRAGVQFEKAIEHAVRNCNAFLCLIGPEWLDASDDRGHRLQDPSDLLRMEIRIALSQKKVVIPILLEQTQMPHASLLPDDIADLTTFHAFKLRDESFGNDAREIQERLVQLREQVLHPTLSGEEILQRMSGGKRAPTAMGRRGGLRGEALASDLNTGSWKNQIYQVRFDGPPSGRNWFSPREFASRIDQQAEQQN